MEHSSSMKTPMSTTLKLHSDPDGKDVNATIYRGMIGSLMYLTASRPHIMFSTFLCARFQSKPKESHLAAVKRIFRYLKGTADLGLWYPKETGFELTAYSDADHAGNMLDRKSTSGHVQFLGDRLVSWASKKQNCVSTSTAEAEYVAAASCCSQVIWMRTQLKDYGFNYSRIPIYCDSKSAIAISSNPVQHTKTKHIDVRYHFINYHMEKGTIELYFVNSEHQLADLFTKALDEKQFNYLVSKLGTTAQNQPPAIDPIADAELIPEDQFLPLTAKNYHLDVTQLAIQHQVIIEILRGHPLSYALTETATVPIIYLQQFWRFLHALEAEGGFHLEGRIDHTPVLLTSDLFRQFLRLPTAGSVAGQEDFDPLVSDATLCTDLILLGYGAELRIPSTFNRKHLSTLWYTLFTYINRCLSSITKGIDQTSAPILRIFHAVAFNRHVDFADLLWFELIQRVRSTASRRSNIVPFMRFLQIIIRNYMNLYPEIQRRSTHPMCPQHPTRKIPSRADPEGVVARQIPVGVLDHARPTALSVIAYRHTHNIPAPMVRPGPAGPAQGARPERREGQRPRTKGGSVRIAGASGQGVSRAIIVRGTGVGSAVGTSQPSSSRQPSSPPTTDTPMTEEATDSEAVQVQSSSVAATEGTSATSDTEGTQTATSASNEESSDSDGDDNQPTSGEIRRGKGVLVEHQEVSCVMESRSKLHSESTRVMGQPSSVVSPPATSSQVATSAIQSHVLGLGIEEAAVDLAAQLHAQPSHSTISQQMVVSHAHGDLAHTLSGSHLEGADIETREQLPPFSPSLHARSLDPFVIHAIPRSHIPFLAIAGSLSGPAGTSIVNPPSGRLRGLDGSPTTAIITPTVNIGGSTSTVVATTGSLSDPGVTQTEFVSREYMDGALKAVQSMMTEELDNIKCMVKGKGPATEPETTSIPSSLSAADLSIPELKSILLAKLIAQSQTEPTQDADLLSLLRSQASTPTPPTPQPIVSAEAFQIQQVMLQSLQQTVAVLTERLSAVEDTCRGQAERLKRRHDDQDDPDHHDGEKRQRRSEPESHVVESEQVEQGTGSGTRTEGQRQEQEQERESVTDLILYDYPTVEKPEEFEFDSPIVPEDWTIILDPYEVTDTIEECANSERALVVMQEEIDEILHPDDQSSTVIPLLTYPVNYPEFSATVVPERSPPASTVRKPVNTTPARPSKWERVRIKVPFLEESQKRIFAHWIRKYDEVVIHGLQSVKNKEKQRELVFVYRKFQHKYSKTKLRIVSVDKIIPAYFMKVKYTDFMVTREDGQQYCFSDADFPCLEPQDLLYILRDLKTRTVRPGEVIYALETVKRYMKCAIKLASVEDFQIGLESNQPKINLLKPDLKIPSDTQNVPAFTVIKFPEFGMTYVNDKGIMHFIRFNQIASFCDGTLMLLKDKLKRALDKDEKGVQLLDPKYKALVLEALGEIEERLEYRTQIRYFEISFRFRKIYVPNWRDYQLLFKGGDC
ncbi:hypothetical protein L6452_15159 [Arctium lappa]|uniref:Uncharacterized protein n=1 Tax=Arctium lappa TaxID=4217 RepID=A0ACB9CN49_ARCLA|nr:hypothetical protein L6452_15159 [Arctium lappa]